MAETGRARQQRSPPAGRDLDTFRGFLRAGKPGAHAYVALLGLRTYETESLLRRVDRGFSYRTIDHLQRNLGLSIEDVSKLVRIPTRTLTRRKERGRLEPDESDRVIRASRVLGKALELFEGDEEAARSWLATPQPALAGERPIQLARTDLGAREVERLVDRLEHGVFS